VDNPLFPILQADMLLAERAIFILEKSAKKSSRLLFEAESRVLTDDDRETFEALTSRFGRALDFMTQKLLRTIDRIELTDEGSVLDRVNRFKKRKILRDEINYGLLKDLRNQIVHEYIIDETDRVVRESLNHTPLLRDMLDKAREYCERRGFIGPG